MDFLTRQKKLQAEAKMALAMAKPMAKMQVEVEKQNRKKSPVADLVSGAWGWEMPPFYTLLLLLEAYRAARGACSRCLWTCGGAVEIGTVSQELKG